MQTQAKQPECVCDPECWVPTPKVSGIFFLRCFASLWVYRASVIEPRPIMVEGEECPLHGFRYYWGLHSFEVCHRTPEREVVPLLLSAPGSCTKEGMQVVLPFAANNLTLSVTVAKHKGTDQTHLHQAWDYEQLNEAISEHKRIDVWL